jgi:hypothetical protein
LWRLVYVSAAAFFGGSTIGASLMGPFDGFFFEAEETKGAGSCTLASSSIALPLESENPRLKQVNP